MTLANRRLAQLDVLRAVAVLLVLGRHLTPAAPEDAGWLVAAGTRIWQRGGWIGVDLFFVLSGFLVSGLLFREYLQTGTVHPGRFLIRRGFKIYPAFYVLTLPVVLIFGASTTPSAIAGELFFLQNYLGGLWGHTWSLAVEEHFYLLLAGYVWCMVRLRPSQSFRAIPATFVIVAMFCLISRIAEANQPGTHFTQLLNPTHLRLDALIFGVLLSYYWHSGDLQRQARRWRAWLLVAGIALLAPAFVFALGRTPWLPVIGLTGFYMGAGALLIGFLSVELPQTRFVRALATIGACSYSIYLWHWLVRITTMTFLLDAGHGWIVYATAYLTGSIAVGLLAARAIEVPTLAIRDRYFPSRAATSRDRWRGIDARVTTATPTSSIGG